MNLYFTDISYDDLSRDELKLLLAFNLKMKETSVELNEIQLYQQKIQYIENLLK